MIVLSSIGLGKGKTWHSEGENCCKDGISGIDRKTR